VGDLLVLSNFINGGGTPVPKAYEWVGSGGSDGALNFIPMDTTKIFAIVNSTSVPSPWPYTPKFGPTGFFPAGAFFEGGIDLAGIQGVDPCFASFLMETRASSAVSAELKDFVAGDFFVSSP